MEGKSAESPERCARRRRDKVEWRELTSGRGRCRLSSLDGGVFDPEACPRMPESPALVSASLPFQESVGSISRRSARPVHPSSSSSRFTLNALLIDSNHLQRMTVNIHDGRRYLRFVRISHLIASDLTSAAQIPRTPVSNPVSNTSPGVQALSPSNFPHTPVIGFPPSFSPRSRTGPKNWRQP